MELFILLYILTLLTGLDEAEAFGDVELLAEFSLLSVVKNLQQGKMSTNLLETLEVKRGRKVVYIFCIYPAVYDYGKPLENVFT